MNRPQQDGKQVTPVERASGVAREPYRPPRLIRHGTLQELTQGKCCNQLEQGSNIP